MLAEPHVIFTHDDDALGPAGTEERMAFVRDSEGNTLGLVTHQPVRGDDPHANTAFASDRPPLAH